jgi:hypothetical protein
MMFYSGRFKAQTNLSGKAVSDISSDLDETINAKGLLKHLEIVIGLLAESFERSMGEVDGGL